MFSMAVSNAINERVATSWVEISKKTKTIFKKTFEQMTHLDTKIPHVCFQVNLTS